MFYRLRTTQLASVHLIIILMATLSCSVAAQSVRNIVVGEGCSSVCVDGRCERKCRSSNGKLSVTKNDSVELSGRETGVTHREFEFSDFSALIANDVNVRVRAGEPWGVSASGTKACLEQLDLQLTKGVAQRRVLRLGLAASCDERAGVTVAIVAPSIQSVRAYGNADVLIEGFFQKTLNVEASQNASVELVSNQLSNFSLKTDGNADVSSQKSLIFSSDVMLNDRSDVKLRFPFGREGRDTGLITGVVSGMAELQYCGKVSDTTKVLNMADVSQTDCDSLRRYE